MLGAAGTLIWACRPSRGPRSLRLHRTVGMRAETRSTASAADFCHRPRRHASSARWARPLRSASARTNDRRSYSADASSCVPASASARRHSCVGRRLPPFTPAGAAATQCASPLLSSKCRGGDNAIGGSSEPSFVAWLPYHAAEDDEEAGARTAGDTSRGLQAQHASRAETPSAFANSTASSHQREFTVYSAQESPSASTKGASSQALPPYSGNLGRVSSRERSC